MKRFMAGTVVGACMSTLTLVGQKLASEKVAQPQPVFGTQKVKAVHCVLKPGEGMPLHTHRLDHLAVVLQGSTLRDMETDGTYRGVEQRTGELV